VCVYDRSDASQTSQQYVEDLHGLLAGTGLKGPYVLVGHSYGGLNVILYADKYPQEVAGVMLEDIFTPDFITRFLAELPAAPEDTQDLKDDREFWGRTPLIIKRVDVTTSIAQAAAVKSLGAIPLLVLTAAAPDLDFGKVGEEAQAKIDEVDQATQKDLTRLSSNSKQIISSTNHHLIHEYVPEEVIAAILQLVEMVRSK
jgi:pimeloyl-ACP methyl ester carboxylesterase